MLDAFGGCGTTCAVAQKMGRRWIIADINKGAIQTTSKRIQNIINNQKMGQDLLNGKPQSDSFIHYRINDYDQNMQHNEFKDMVIKHFGIQVSKNDSFFDGKLGNALVKIIPFNHPFTILDIQMLKDELKNRPDETRDITIVSLGQELAVQEELKQFNRIRPINKITVIDLRLDPKDGFIMHDPVSADVSIIKEAGKVKIKVNDFISPSIIKRLSMDESVFRTKIKDFRSQIDCVLIDTDYDGKTFNILMHQKRKMI